MNKFKIWFDQVNQEMYEIEAKTEEEAIKKAKRKWMSSHGNPDPDYIEVAKEGQMREGVSKDKNGYKRRMASNLQIQG